MIEFFLANVTPVVFHAVSETTFCLANVAKLWTFFTRKSVHHVWGVAVDRAIYLPDFVGPETLVGGCLFTDPAELATF